MDAKSWATNPTLEFARNPLTCITCRIMFREVEVRNKHYKSEWHRYNLHRKIANLPSVTSDEFERKAAVYNEGNQTKQSKNCDICRKKFSSEKQYENHLASKKHKQKTKETNTEEHTSRSVCNETKMDVSDVSDTSDSDLDLENPIERNDCLFCDHHSRSTTRNLKHMMVGHSFFVPDFEYCIDKRGLLMYLAEKIYIDYKCIWCNNSGRQLRSAEAVKTHMIDKGHCKMLFEGEALLEYMHFYDYTSSYPDAKDADPDAELPEPPEILLDDGYELELPSGKIIGHRALVCYYKQNLPSSKAITMAKTRGHKLRKFMMQYRALGGPQVQAEAMQRRARDIRYLQRVQTKYSTQLQFKQNKLQHHYRPQINF